MKVLHAFLLVGLTILASCSSNSDDVTVVDEGSYGFYIVGINKSLTYTFSPGNGRKSSSVPEDVKNLGIYIMDANDQLVYQQHYYQYNYYGEYKDSLDANGEDYYYYESTIPDSIFIPKLAEGTYTILASTADNYYYYANDYYPGDDHQGNEYDTYPRIGSYVVSEGPIYVGKETFELTADEMYIDVAMENISSKVTVAWSSPNSTTCYVQLSLQTSNEKDYSFLTEEMVDAQYDYGYVYTWLDWQSEHSTFLLPKTITAVQINYYDYQSQTQISQEVTMDPPIELGVGDAITFTIDVEALLQGSGRGAFEWGGIDWNDLGSISVP